MDGERGGVVLGLAAMEEGRTESKRLLCGRALQSVRRPWPAGGRGYSTSRQRGQARRPTQWHRTTAAWDQMQQATCVCLGACRQTQSATASSSQWLPVAAAARRCKGKWPAGNVTAAGVINPRPRHPPLHLLPLVPDHAPSWGPRPSAAHPHIHTPPAIPTLLSLPAVFGPSFSPVLHPRHRRRPGRRWCWCCRAVVSP